MGKFKTKLRKQEPKEAGNRKLSQRRTSIETSWLECCQNLGKNCYRKSPGRMLPVILPPPDSLFSLMTDITTISVNSLLDPLPLHHSWIQCQNPPEQISVTCWLSWCLGEGRSALLWFLYWENCWDARQPRHRSTYAHTRVYTCPGCHTCVCLWTCYSVLLLCLFILLPLWYYFKFRHFIISCKIW